MAFRLVDSHFRISNNMLDKDYELPCTTTGCGVIYQRLKNMMVPEMAVSESEPSFFNYRVARTIFDLGHHVQVCTALLWSIGPSVQIRNV